MSEERVRLRKPLRRALRRGHPWVYRDALARLTVTPGAVVTVVDERDRFIARGWADEGPIAVRVLTTRDEPVDAALLARKLEAAAALRASVVPPETDAYRLVHGEGDGLPGIVCDRYGSFATLQLDGSAAVAWRRSIIGALVPYLEGAGIRGLVVRSGRRGRRRVDLGWGEPAPPEVHVREQGVVLVVDLMAGQKTGLFLDHRPSRRCVRRLAASRRVLDLYAYTGGFSAAAGLGGASHVVTVDSAAAALALAKRTWEANGLDARRHECVVADVPEYLTALEASGRRFGLIVADPPSFAPNQAARHNAQRAYAKLHRAATTLLAPGGFLLAASCSSHIDRRDFEDALIDGADKARRRLQVLDRWGAPPDHPRLLGFPEGDYLKVIVARVVGDAD